MLTEYGILFGSALMGFGLGGIFYKQSLMGIILSLSTVGMGVLVTFASVARTVGDVADTQSELLFLFCLGVTVLSVVILGCVLAYRRFMTSHKIKINKGNQLVH